jgi:hypothetical protein
MVSLSNHWTSSLDCDILLAEVENMTIDFLGVQAELVPVERSEVWRRLCTALEDPNETKTYDDLLCWAEDAWAAGKIVDCHHYLLAIGH